MSITIKNNKKNKLFKLHKNKLLKDKNKINYSFFSMKYKNLYENVNILLRVNCLLFLKILHFLYVCVYIYKGAVGETSSAPFSE